METLFNGFTLQIAPGTFPLSTDSMALAAYVRMPKNARILDLGAGCATLGVMLCAHDPSCTVTGVEIDPVAHEAALENAHRNGIAHRLAVYARTWPSFPLLWNRAALISAFPIRLILQPVPTAAPRHWPGMKLPAAWAH